MKRWERMASIALFLIGVGAAIGAWQIGFGSYKAPGPGFFPFWLAIVLTILSAVFYYRNLGTDKQKAILWTTGSWVRPVKAIVVMFAYVFLIDILGFISSTAILFVAWLRIIERSSWKSVALLVVIGTTCLYLFATFLQISLPSGILF